MSNTQPAPGESHVMWYLQRCIDRKKTGDAGPVVVSLCATASREPIADPSATPKVDSARKRRRSSPVTPATKTKAGGKRRRSKDTVNAETDDADKGDGGSSAAASPAETETTPAKRGRAAATSGQKKKKKAPGSGGGDNGDADKATPAKKKQKRKAAAAKPEPPARTATPRQSALTGPGFTLLSWNVDGVRAKGRHDKLVEIASGKEAPDLICIQETKLQEKHEADFVELLSEHGYTGVFSSSTGKKGYAGTGVYYKSEGGGDGKTKGGIGSFFAAKPKAKESAGPANPVAKVTCGFDTKHGFGVEGRSITVEYDLFYIVNLYVLNAGQKLERLDERLDGWNKDLLAYVRKLETRKPVVMVGDLNVAHLDADIWNAEAKHIPKIPGCTQKERAAFGELLTGEGGFVDTFRGFHPDATGAFTYWSTKAVTARADGKGLRLDYAVASQALCTADAPRVNDSWIHDEAPYRGCSDHCPIGVEIALA